MSAAAGPDQAETDPDIIGSACIPIDTNMRLDSLEMRTRTLEAQVRSMAKVLASLVDGDGGAA